MKLTVLFGIISLSLVILFGSQPASAIVYGHGSYGKCQYEACATTITSSGTVAVNVTPAAGSTKCSVAKDTVTVTTSSSTGYTLKLSDSDTTNAMVAGANTIPAATGSYASPAVLAANRWGYRVDSQGTFGAGPTSAVSNGTIPTLTFALVPLSSGTPDTITTTSTSAPSGNATSVWYGVCVNTSVPSSTYNDAVTYTVIAN